MPIIGRRAALHVTLALLGSLAFVPQAPAHAARAVDFLYIESNEGGSSGGHAAVRIHDRVYHFEHISPGLLRMRRATPDSFDYIYATLSNRPIHVLHLAVGEEEYTRLRETFSRRHVAQDAQFALREALQRDRALFTHLRQRSAPTAAPLPAALAQLLLIPAAGLFADPAAHADDTGDDLGVAATLGSLANRIGQRHGGDFLAARAAGIRAGIEGLPVQAAADCDRPIDPDTLPTCALPISTRWHALVTAARALEILGHARRLRPESYRACGDADCRLRADEVATIQAQAGKLETDLVDLVASSRPDWGFGFIVGMARLVALRASAAQQRFIVVGDSTAALGNVATLQDDPAFPEIVAAMESEAVHNWSALRATTLATPEFHEGDYTALELATHRVVALRHAIGAQRLSAHPSLYPSAGIANDGTWPSAVPSGTELEQVTAVAAAYDAALAHAYGYNLITRNCVTEVTALIDQAAGAEASKPRDTSGSLHAALGFIPFVASSVVAVQHRIVAEDVSPSYRQRSMAAMSRQEAPALVALLESNTLTSRVYRPWSRDSTFLLFTSDAVWTRPLFGVVNVAIGAGATALGVLRLPLHGVHPLIAGARGVLYSLPELAFVNIRKGTFAFVPQHPPQEADGTSASAL